MIGLKLASDISKMDLQYPSYSYTMMNKVCKSAFDDMQSVFDDGHIVKNNH